MNNGWYFRMQCLGNGLSDLLKIVTDLDSVSEIFLSELVSWSKVTTVKLRGYFAPFTESGVTGENMPV